MARKPHKYAGSHLSGTTSLDPAGVAEVARSAGEAIRKVRLEGETAGRVHFSVRHLKMVEWMTFDVEITQDANGCAVETRIGRYMTSQATALGIPVGPKEMLGYKIYRNYMHSLAAGLKDKDATSRCQITELSI